jgi:ribosomal protein S18 acetylase RimI-like enzyme
MTVSTRRVWRTAKPALLLARSLALLVGVAAPVFAYLIYRREKAMWLPVLLLTLAGLALLYGWRFWLHPQIRARGDALHVVNPFRRYALEWDDVTVIAPGENGLLIGTEDRVVEAWCVQKSKSAIKREKLTRADRIAAELIDILERYNPPISDEETGLRIRRARPHEARLLTRMEQAAAEATLGHIFPPEEFPYPTDAVAGRWQDLMHDRFSRVHVLELWTEPVGYVAFDADTVLHLGVDPRHLRRGYGSALLEFASLEIFDGGAPEAQLWVLVENAVGRAFFRSHGWRETDERRHSRFPPHPREIKMVCRNPSAPRRSR